MSLQDRLSADMKLALKSGEKQRLGCIRMLLARLKDRQVALRQKHGADYRLDDEAATEVVAAYAKQRRDSIESYRAAGREDLAVGEEQELAVVESYLPAQLGDEQLRTIVREAIAKTGASSMKDIGKVMKEVMPRVKGQADGKRINQVARELLG